MRNLFIVTTLLISIPMIVFGELTSVELGGKIEIYGLYYHKFIEPSDAERIPPSVLRGRSIGPTGTVSIYRTGDGSTSTSYVEQRTRLHTRAQFTDNISAFIELDSIDHWGEDFRSKSYASGYDERSNSIDDVELFQAYVQLNDIYDVSGLKLTIGRQAIDLGSGWLVGSDPGPNPLVGLSFDAIRLQYEQEKYVLDLFYGKIFEGYGSINHDDIDFWSVYFTINELLEGANLDVYYFLLRDDTPIPEPEVDLPLAQRLIVDLFGVNDYDPTYIHTLGVRLFGEYRDFDYEFEVAYQWGKSSRLGSMFVPIGGKYGDMDADWSLPAGHFEVGYTWSEAKWTPRVYVGGCYYHGEDNRDVSFIDWLIEPIRGKASPSFNRLFTTYRHDSFIDLSGMSNFWKLNTGISVKPMEKIEVGLDVAYMEVVAPFDRPISVQIGDAIIYPLGYFPFITTESDSELGWQTLLSLSYNYSDDLTFSIGWSHFFIGKGLAQGAFLDNYGTAFVSTVNQTDADFFYFYTTLEF